MKIFCCVCGKQAVDQLTSSEDHVTTLYGAKAGFKSGECFCGHCARDLDENGLFPEERIESHN